VQSLKAFSSRLDDAARVNLASLKHAKIDVNTISVSGLSSGGFMTTMIQTIFSSIIKGAGIYAGGECFFCKNEIY